MASRGSLGARRGLALRQLETIQQKASAAGVELPAARALTKSDEVNAVQQVEDLVTQLDFAVDRLIELQDKNQPDTKTESPGLVMTTEAVTAEESPQGESETEETGQVEDEPTETVKPRRGRKPK